MRVTVEESAQLTALADAQGITVARLLVESALAGDREIASQRRDAIGQVFALRRLLAAVSNNLNQVARHANAIGEMPGDAEAVVAAIRRLVPRLSAAAESLAVNPPRRKPLTDSRQALLSDRPTEEALEASAAAWGEAIGAGEDREAVERAASDGTGSDSQLGERGRR